MASVRRRVLLIPFNGYYEDPLYKKTLVFVFDGPATSHATFLGTESYLFTPMARRPRWPWWASIKGVERDMQVFLGPTAKEKRLKYLLPVVVALMVAITAPPPTDRGAPEAGTVTILPGPVTDTSDIPMLDQGSIEKGFTENKGQLGDVCVLYYARTGNGRIALQEDGLLVTILDGTSEGSGSQYPIGPRLREDDVERLGSRAVRGHNVKVVFTGANDVVPAAIKPLPGVINYMLGEDPSTWLTHLRSYREVLYEDLYEGIDLVVQMAGDAPKYEFLVRPWARVEDIKLTLVGSDGIELVGEDTIRIQTPMGCIEDGELVAWYGDGGGEGLDCRFRLLDGPSYGFELIERDPRRLVVIDPIVYGTFVGGSTDGRGYAVDVEVDDEGCAYVGGETNADDFPTTPGAFQRVFEYWTDSSTLYKVSPDGSHLEYSTFFGNWSEIHGLCVDAGGHAFITGTVHEDGEVPITEGAFQQAHRRGTWDAFVAKLTPDGSGLVYSTYFGGSGSDFGNDIEVDPRGRAYIVGDTGSVDLPTNPGIFQRDHGGGRSDGYLALLSADGTSRIITTYIGGRRWDVVNHLELDSGGRVLLGGHTNSSDFPSTHELSRPNNYNSWAFVCNMSWNGITASHCTLLYQAWMTGLELDSMNHIYVSGHYYGNAYAPPTPDAFSKDGGSWVLELDPTAKDLLYCSHIGGETTGLVVDEWGTIFIVSDTKAMGLPVTEGALDPTYSGDFDVYFVAIPKKGRPYATYVGGTEEDVAREINTGPNGTIFIVGRSSSPGFPVTSGAFDTETDDDTDQYVLKLWLDFEPPVADAGPDVVCGVNDTVILDGFNSTDNDGIMRWSWSYVDEGRTVTRTGRSVQFKFERLGDYLVQLNVTDFSGNWAVDELVVSVRDLVPPVADAGIDMLVGVGDTVLLDGSGSWDDLGIVEWRWTLVHMGVDVALPGERQSFRFQRVGEYAVTLTVTDASGNWDDDEMNVTVVDDEPPVADAGRDRILALGEVTTFSGAGSTDNVGVVSFHWEVETSEGTVVKEEVSFSMSFQRYGQYLVTLRAHDASGNWDEDTVDVTVADLRAPVARAGPDRRVQEGTRVTLDGSNSSDDEGIVSWTWKFSYEGRPVDLDGELVNFTFDVEGVYTIQLVVEDSFGNVGTDGLVVTVTPVIEPEPEPEPGPEEPSEEPVFTARTWLYAVLIIVAAFLSALYWLYRRQERIRREGGGQEFRLPGS